MNILYLTITIISLHSLSKATLTGDINTVSGNSSGTILINESTGTVPLMDESSSNSSLSDTQGSLEPISPQVESSGVGSVDIGPLGVNFTGTVDFGTSTKASSETTISVNSTTQITPQNVSSTSIEESSSTSVPLAIGKIWVLL